jgi:hypothetical protein
LKVNPEEEEKNEIPINQINQIVENSKEEAELVKGPEERIKVDS